ncbi:MAG TPA: efflux RND transporter permease subunit, partial [Beijerinckiaceae bacterium]|nr:efflux RND transporter permease subunit [Beijerinckiaceae bacterium]
RRGRPAPPPPDHSDPYAIYRTPVYNGLRRAVSWSVDHKYVTVGAVLLILAGSIAAFTRVQHQFFPISSRPELFFQMRMPQGTSITASLDIAKRGEAMLKDDKDIATFTTYVGQGSPRFWLGLNPQLPDEAFAEIVIIARDVAARERIKARLEGEVAAGKLSEARVRVDRFNFGPPVGFPVQFRVIGPDPASVRETALKVRDIMRANVAARDPHFDWNEQTPSVRLVVDQDRARALGLNVQDVSNMLQTWLSGVTVTSVRDRTERVDVVARAAPAERADLSRIGELTIATRGGVPVPLAQVARIEYVHEDPILWRRSRELAITVRADVVDGVQPPTVSHDVGEALKPLIATLPPGMRIEQGGSVEESGKANSSIFMLFPLMILGMLTILMLQLQSFSRLFLVFAPAPLGIVGASIGLNLFNAPFGFVALLGLIALAGMDMRNTVILVQQIDEDLAAGADMREAVIEATVRRARPVVLTALSAILAMIPLSTSLFWGPMAITIAGGLATATFMTLLFLPALYSIWFKVQPARNRAPVVAPPSPEQVQDEALTMITRMAAE